MRKETHVSKFCQKKCCKLNGMRERARARQIVNGLRKINTHNQSLLCTFALPLSFEPQTPTHPYSWDAHKLIRSSISWTCRIHYAFRNILDGHHTHTGTYRRYMCIVAISTLVRVSSNWVEVLSAGVTVLRRYFIVYIKPFFQLRLFFPLRCLHSHHNYMHKNRFVLMYA